MSRLIVKNLPPKVKADELRKKFSQKGDVTDVQLAYTSEGKFRKFAFIGFKNEEQAASALSHFDNTFYHTSKMKVELCSDLGSADKAKPWSKHTKNKTKPDPPAVQISEGNKRKDKPKYDKELLDRVEKHKSDPEFKEFLEVHSGVAEKLLVMCRKSDEDSGMEDAAEVEEETIEVSAANTAISDMDYLRLKTKRTNAESTETPEPPAVEPNKHENLFTVKIKNLPKGVKKHDIREMLKPLTPVSVRKARGLLGVAFVGFRTEKDMKKALIKNKTFIKGKQLSVSECTSSKRTIEKTVPEKWVRQEEALEGEESIGESGRIFLRNLCYSATEQDLETVFSKYGPISEVCLPIDKLTRKAKGYGIVTFVFPEHAVAAYTELDGTVFQGRMMHLLPGKAKHEDQLPDSSNFKQAKQAKLKKTAGLSHNWNTLFLGRNAVADVIAETYKASKQDVLTGKEAAVRLALGETQLVSSTREFLIQNGVRLDAFSQQVEKRSKNVILVKNLPANTECDEIRALFEKFGVLGRVVLPPSGIMAVVEFEEPSEARTAFIKLAYTKFKYLPLYLEWAPDNTFLVESGESTEKDSLDNPNPKEDQTEQSREEELSDDETEPEPDTTLYVKNLNFNTSENDLKEHFSKCGKLFSVSVSRKKDPKNPGKMLSLGYGFVQFYLRSSVNKALSDLQNSELGGHRLELKRSDRTTNLPTVISRKTTNVKKQTGTKILVRNIPFQADVQEIKQLFSAFGEIKSVRLPKKLVGTGKHRGFGFVDFSTRHEAKSAMKALCHSTHLYGRRLVLEWASLEEEEADSIMKRTAHHFNTSSLEPAKKQKAVADFQQVENSDDE